MKHNPQKYDFQRPASRAKGESGRGIGGKRKVKARARHRKRY